MTMDAVGLDRLVADLTDAPRRVQIGTFAAVERNGQQLEDDARRFAPSGPHTPSYAQSITHDVRHAGGGMIEAEVGPDPSLSQGPLGNIFEFGTGRHAPQPHLSPALDLAGPRLEKDISDLDDGL